MRPESVSGPPIMLLGQRVLVVEDEAILTLLIEDRLLAAGATIIGPAATVDEALQLIEDATATGGLAAAVLDIGLPGERALPVADRLAELGVPFLITSGYGPTSDWGQHTTAPFLPKPFDPEQLVAAVRTLCGPPGHQDAAGP